MTNQTATKRLIKRDLEFEWFENVMRSSAYQGNEVDTLLLKDMFKYLKYIKNNNDKLVEALKAMIAIDGNEHINKLKAELFRMAPDIEFKIKQALSAETAESEAE